MKTIKIGFLGFGNVGRGAYRILTENAKDIQHREELDIQVKKILVRDPSKKRQYSAPAELLTADISEILEDEEISLIAEFMGGVTPAREYILRALKKGKTVVTANKEVLSKYWPEFLKTAQENNAGLYYEATVGGGMPVIRMITDSMQANNITELMGIINGTTNYILSNMAEQGSDYSDVLKEAQKLGYAEADPTSDVEGYDAMYKLSILGSLAFHSQIPVEKIFHEGITRISAEDIKWGRELGYAIKLLAIGKKNGNVIQARVHPTMIPLDHPLASVRGAFNAVFVKGHAVGEIMLYGRGAGDMPTGSAVVSDIITACHRDEPFYPTFRMEENGSPDVEFNYDWESSYFINISVTDKPGTLSTVTGILGKHQVSLKSVLQKETIGDKATVIMMTHQAREQAVKNAIAEIAALPEVESINNVIRVEE